MLMIYLTNTASSGDYYSLPYDGIINQSYSQSHGVHIDKPGTYKLSIEYYSPGSSPAPNEIYFEDNSSNTMYLTGKENSINIVLNYE